MAEHQDTKNIEADLKRMLNMDVVQPLPDNEGGNSARKSVSISKADLDIVKEKTHPQQRNAKNKGKAVEMPGDNESQNEKMAKHNREANNSALDNRNEEQNSKNIENEVSKKKSKQKKKRGKKKKTKDILDELKQKGDPDSDSEEDEKEEPKKDMTGVTPFNLQQKYLDENVTPAILKELEAQRIYPLKKKSIPFPKALYFCRLCDYHCDNVPVCRQHADDARHRRRLEIMIQDKTLKNLQTPPAEHFSALTRILEDIYHNHGLSDEDIKEREQIAESLQEFLQKTIPGLELRIYGSTLTGFGIKTSNLNLDLVLTSGMNAAKGLSQVHKILKQSDVCKEVKSNFQAKVPTVLFKSPCGKVNCEISIGSNLAYFTSKYLTLYSRLDVRLRKLAVIFKYWANVCELDVQESGTLPSYCYDLMTVYFLQQINPRVLPVLWKDLSEEVLRRPKTHTDIFDMFEELQKEAWKSLNEDSLGELWRDLLLFYGVKFEMAETVVCIRSHKLIRRHEKKWKSKRVAIEDPLSPKRNVARSMHNSRVFDYFYNCLRKACLYFSVPTSESNVSLNKDENCVKSGNHMTEKSLEENVVSRVSETRTQKNEVKCQDLIDDAESESSGFTGTESDASIKPHIFLDKTNESAIEISDFEESVEVVEQENKGPGDEKVEKESVEWVIMNDTNSDREKTDTASMSVDNLTKIVAVDKESLSSGNVLLDTGANLNDTDRIDSNDCDNIIDELNSDSAISDKIELNSNDDSGNSVKDDSSVQADTLTNEVFKTVETCEDTPEMDLAVNSEGITVNNEICLSDIVNIDKQDDGSNGEGKSDEAVIVDATDEVDESGSLSNSDMETDNSDVSPVAEKRKEEASSHQHTEIQYNFVFSLQTLTDGKGPSIFCQICEQEGHHKNNCPEDRLPTLQQLPPVTPKHLEFLSYAVEKVPKDFSLSKEELREREYIRKNIELHLLDEFPDCELTLFGSSKNGFGFHHSDLDICVTLKNKSQKDVDFIECISAIAKKLKTHRGLYNVFPITTAKVPIVKFKHRNSQLEGDISMYNVLALQNTKLLLTYANIDKRASILGFAIKVFAKVCDIGDASKGSLSSYAYMLLMFHYLQHTNPPVIPVLQELRTNDTKDPELMIDGWNAWFYDDLKTIPKVWPHYGKNKQSVGELWLGFFRYYMEEFNIIEQVVTIKQYETLTKFEKLWNGRCIAIEDPFDLNHNLGSGLSRRMNQYILRTFIHARELYGKPINLVPNGFDTIEDYFFDRKQLTEGKPPADRLCRVCSKIGHIAKECPRVLARKEREVAERKRREEMRLAQENKNNSQNIHNHQGNNSPQRHPPPTRSKSDPAEYGSPNRHVNSQMYHRQLSETNDHRQMATGPDGHFPNYSQLSSPKSLPYQHRYSQSKSPKTSNPHAYSPQPRQYPYRTGHPSNLFRRTNQNEYSNTRFSNAAYQMKSNSNMPANMDNRNVSHQHNRHPANHNRDYSSSPNHNPAFINRGSQSEGPRQQGKRQERVVNIHENSGPLSAVGVTVKNDLYKGTTNMKNQGSKDGDMR